MCGLNKMYTLFCSFSTSLLLLFSVVRRLYFLSMDISNCYDSIPQDKLMKIMENAINRVRVTCITAL